VLTTNLILLTILSRVLDKTATAAQDRTVKHYLSLSLVLSFRFNILVHVRTGYVICISKLQKNHY